MNSVCKIIYLILALIPLSSLALPTPDLGRFVDKGTTTVDSVSGLEWLDLSVSLGRSYFDVAEQFGPHGDFAGYRFATSTDVNEMFYVFQFPNTWEPLIDPNALHFIDLFGVTFSEEWEDGYLIESRGYVESPDTLRQNPPTVDAPGIMVRDITGYGPATVTIRDEPVFEPSHSYSIGSFLVREYDGAPLSVPEIDATPAPLAMSLLLLTAFLQWERHRSGSSIHNMPARRSHEAE